jgi:hypothetical protein
MEASDIIFKLIIGIVVLIVYSYIMSFITGEISKFDSTSALNGNVVATPEAWDESKKTHIR